MRALAVLAFLLAFLPGLAGAVQPDEVLADPALESRAREISKGLRCLVCQNESIDESNATLARDLRLLVRERLVGGDSNAEVLDFVVQRYGDFVLLSPPVRPSTWLLWYGPFGLLLAGAIAAVFYLRAQRRPAAVAEPELTGEERRRIEALLADEDRNS
ncbi:MAG: cytochrome c-type biogenesis protein CcmH [Alphaproteobacteria bacterium]|nr:cytochrome c-type biogenesis protein CcmH [Alphaproteobacteria bacterium]MBU0796317.1 cytochrome c-type biogenesis protein CcmH [Alphaproteobacteria bacterium]MBU0889166.1 cytochrome c-type biogenesis protein CcmH [Alphaproteobacteria bacterium]MBU1812200.1 cytochrome c-type biogenesis protein CcmH [Alphaproteobacteria bacterium]